MLKEIQIIMEQDQKLNQMVNKFFSVMAILILLSCQNQKSEKKQNATNKANIEVNKTILIPEYNADMGVKDVVKLMNSESVNENIGNTSELEYYNDFLFLSNTNETECLVIGRSYGGEKNEFKSCRDKTLNFR